MGAWRPSPRASGALTVGAGVLLLSPDALAIRLVSADTWTILFWRGACTSLGYLALVWMLRRRTGREPRPRRSRRSSAAIGCLTVSGNVCFVSSVAHTSAARTLVVLSCSPLLAAIITHVCRFETIDRRTWLSASIVVPCMALIVATSGGGGLAPSDLAAPVGAVSLASLLVVIRRSGDADVVPALALGGAMTALFALLFAGTLALSAEDALVIVLACALLLPLALSLITTGPRHLAAPEVALFLLLETVLGPLWVWLALGERPAREVVLAGAVIIATLALSSLAALRHLKSLLPRESEDLL